MILNEDDKVNLWRPNWFLETAEKVTLSTSSLPLDVKEILTNCIESVAQLETLFLFYQDSNKCWSVASLSKELRSNETSVTRQLHHLEECGFIKKSDVDQYVYSPANEKIGENVRKLHEVFSEKQVAVIAYLYEKPNDKLKGFADAFKFKKD